MASRLADLIRKARRLAAERDRLIDALAADWTRALRGQGLHHAIYGTLCSPETFGNYGAGSALFWVDPVREITFAFLSAGVMGQAQNIERFQRICDIVTSAAT